MSGVSRVSNTATLLQVVEIIDSLINADNVQEKLLLALDTHELVKALNRVTGSHENLSPKLLEALEACRKFCRALEADTLANVVLEKCQDSFLAAADAKLEALVADTVNENISKRVNECTAEHSIAAHSLADAHLLLEGCRQLKAETFETPTEVLMKEQANRCVELLDTIMSPP